jgi:hypothetical protein
MLNPAKQIIECCNNFGVKYTLFAEFGQQLAMEASEDPALKNSATAWKNFLQHVVLSGHDVQLHFHPQWIGAKHRNGRWHLNFKKSSIALLDYSEIRTWLLKGKHYLENLLRPIKPSFRVLAHRAGGWMIQPSENLVQALLNIGIIADCTVIKGLRAGNPPFNHVNFEYAPSALIPWYANKHDMAIMNDRPSGLICIPTFAQTVFLPRPLAEVLINPRSFFWGINRNLYFLKRRRRYQSPPFFKKPEIPFGKADCFELLKRIFAQRVIKLDFGVYHYHTILKIVKNLLMVLNRYNLSNAPLILYTHSKDFYSLDNFKKLLTGLTAMKTIQFVTTQEIVENIHNNLVLSKESFRDSRLKKT